MGRGKYNKRVFPAITISDRRKGSQWFEVDRKLAIQLISDTTYYPIFLTHCQRSCFMDEHYFPTLVNKVCPELTTNRTVTWTDWSRGVIMAKSRPQLVFFLQGSFIQTHYNHC
ncbi:hypothetical protein POM88_027609 [Heracleum sosnowskyi]|uniref:Uncharacterized protein n=1 Tax=Heracleum sosnowskyi TaxID=360622 RepID=A0AAD8MLM6_9APIA|nr:hypothetical protein POM88_027609 [Heracleum sosnowskyi]